jgi:hypothetical protein
MLNLPAMAASEQPIGVVIQTQGGHLGSADAAAGATVYPGDVLDTSNGGTLRLKVGSGQLYLLPASTVTVTQNASVVHAAVARGTVAFSSAATDRLLLETPLAIVRAANGQPAFGQVNIKSPDEMIVSAYQGALIVEGFGEERTLEAGKAYDVTWEPVGMPAQGTAGITPSWNRHLVFKIVILATTAVVAYLIWHYTESPSAPSN